MPANAVLGKLFFQKNAGPEGVSPARHLAFVRVPFPASRQGNNPAQIEAAERTSPHRAQSKRADDAVA